MRPAPALLLALALACAHAGPPVTLSDGRYAMGTALEVTVVAPDAGSGRAALDAVFDEVAALERRVSTWYPDSEVSRLNAEAGGGFREVSADAAALLRRARELGALTHGSFDVTVGPLVALWREAERSGRPPDDAALAAARARVGYGRIEVDRARARLAQPGTLVDLGGIAKGFAVDRVRPLLARHGVLAALVNFGQSSTLAVGHPVDAEGWRLLARGPGESLLGVLTLEDQALSVSGSLGQWVEIAGRRYGHVLDPRNGRPLTTRRQALVVAPDATLAEALSKALLVLGEREGLALVEAQAGCEALLVDADAGPGVWRSAGWDAAVRWEPLALR